MLGREERQFGDIKQEFFVLELARGGKSLVPVSNVEQAGLRALISVNKARALLKRMKDQPEIEASRSWKDRASKYNEGLKSGCADTYSRILQELMYRAKADKLSTTETKMLETARAYFVSEVGEVLRMSVEKIDKSLSDAIATLLPNLDNNAFAEEGADEASDGEEVDDDGEEDGEDEENPEQKAGKKKAKKAAGKKKAQKTAAKKKTAKKKASKKKR